MNDDARRIVAVLMLRLSGYPSSELVEQLGITLKAFEDLCRASSRFMAQMVSVYGDGLMVATQIKIVAECLQGHAPEIIAKKHCMSTEAVLAVLDQATQDLRRFLEEGGRV